MNFKSIKKYTARQQQLSFGAPAEQEYLASHSLLDEQGRLLEEFKEVDEESGRERHLFVYDDQGKLLKHELNMIDDGISETMIYTRDEMGRVITDQKFYGDDPGEKTVFTYEAHDQPVKIERYDADGDFETLEVLEYDATLRLTGHNRYGMERTLEEQTIIVYNEHNLPVEKKILDADGNGISNTAISYNEQNDVIRITEWNSEGKIISDIGTTYDDRHNVVERRIRDFHSRTVRFTYDDNDHCIAEEILDEHGNLSRKNNFEYDERNLLAGESSFYVDTMRGGNFSNSHSRYEYEFHE